ncbi:ECF transporter S component [Natroniella sp. ANB-PHB2]|uniref:ECF transporter S component n=1 Tax=Natroniella sp. ANB-PHB2 TaxID=3384444 RepID=UPI0038D37BB6
MHKTKKLTLAGLLIGLVTIATMVIKIPVPATEGYIHLGDSMIYVAAILFGSKFGSLAGGVGSAIADILLGYTHWALPTLIVKGIKGFIVGKISNPNQIKVDTIRVKDAVAILVGGTWMIVGYYFVSALFSGSFIVPLQGVPMDFVQMGMGAAIAFPVVFALLKSEIIDEITK